MSRNSVNILYQSSDFYAPYAGVSICSLFENNKHITELNVYLLDDNIGEENKKNFDRLAEQYGRRIIFLDTKNILHMLEEKGVHQWHGSYTANYKHFAISMLDKSIGRLLYIDSDTIINSDILPLYSIELNSEQICAMVQDTTPVVHKRNIGMKDEDTYYNTGVILYDCDKWREEQCEQTIINHITNVRSNYPSVEQDIVNVLYSKRTYRLTPEYNYITGFITYGVDSCFYLWSLEANNYYSKYEMKNKQNTAVIYHFIGDVLGRPWEHESSCALVDLWDYFKQLSPWCDVKKDSKQYPFVIRAQRVFFHIFPTQIFNRIYHFAWKIAFFIKDHKQS